MQYIFVTEIVTAVMFMYDMTLLHTHALFFSFFFMQTLPPGSDCDKNSLFCQLKKVPEGRRTARQTA